MAGFSAFTSALATVASKVVTPKKFIHNIAQENNYAELYYLLKGRRMSEVARAGSDVRARVKFQASSKVGWYDVAAEEHDPQDSQDGTWLIAYWHAHMASESWKEEELLVNSGGTEEGDLAEETWTQEIWSKIQSLMTQLHGDLSSSMWAQPNVSTMGTSNASRPYSIPVYLNQMTSGLFNPGSSGGTAFTTIHGINPTSAPYQRYVPLQRTYGGAGATGFTVGDVNNIVGALSRCMRKTEFRPPPVDKEFFVPEDEGSIRGSGGAIFASELGVSRVEGVYVNSQSRWDDQWDPSGNPKFKRTPLVYAAALDNALLYPISTTSVGNEATATVTGPRYYGINANYMKLYFHKRRFMKFLEPFRRNLTTWQQGVNSMATMLCPDRSKHFILYPQASHATT